MLLIKCTSLIPALLFHRRSLGVFSAAGGTNLSDRALQKMPESHQENTAPERLHHGDRGACSGAGSAGRTQTAARWGHLQSGSIWFRVTRVSLLDLFYLQVCPKVLWMESRLLSRIISARRILGPHVPPGCLKVCVKWGNKNNLFFHSIAAQYLYILLFLQTTLLLITPQWSRNSSTRGQF